MVLSQSDEDYVTIYETRNLSDTTSIDLGSGQYNGVHNAYITVTVQDGELTIKGS